MKPAVATETWQWQHDERCPRYETICCQAFISHSRLLASLTTTWSMLCIIAINCLQTNAIQKWMLIVNGHQVLVSCCRSLLESVSFDVVWSAAKPDRAAAAAAVAVACTALQCVNAKQNYFHTACYRNSFSSHLCTQLLAELPAGWKNKYLREPTCVISLIANTRMRLEICKLSHGSITTSRYKHYVFPREPLGRRHLHSILICFVIQQDVLMS